MVRLLCFSVFAFPVARVISMNPHEGIEPRIENNEEASSILTERAVAPTTGIKVDTSFPRSNNVRGASQQQVHRRTSDLLRKELLKNKKIRVFVEYKNKEGKLYAMNNAVEVVKKYDNENALVVLLDSLGLERLEKTSEIKSIEMDHRVFGFGSDVGHRRSLLEDIPYGIQMIEADQLSIGDFIPTVCIADTGYALGHPDLPSDPDFVTGTTRNDAYGGKEVWPWDNDVNGHGTHISGVVAALVGNSVGVRGVGKIKLHITRALSDRSRAYESDILDAIQDCIDAGANILSMSLGGDSMSSRAQRLYESVAEKHNMLFIAAAGNHGKNLHQYPASHPSVISVAAVYEWRKFWEGSNYCSQVELAAPGYMILSTTTSNAAVHTADHGFPADRIGNSMIKEVKGPLVFCGDGEGGCPNANQAICLFVRGVQAPVARLVQTCQLEGGVGAILFSDGTAHGGWDSVTLIPAVRVSEERGALLGRDYEGQIVSIGYRKDDEKEYTYDSFTGTSMAVPHVAGVAALVWSHFPECTNHQIRYALAATADDRGLPGCDWDYGYGIVQAKKAYHFLKKHGCPSEFGKSSTSGGCTVI